MKRLKIWLYRLTRLVLFFFVLVSVLAIFLYWRLVVDEPGAHMRKASILQVIAQESQIHYRSYEPGSRENSQPIGSLFSGHHRQYVSYKDLPNDWINAIISSEDHLFFSHYGISPLGILRAVKSNITAGRVVSGGSTLTQQTAKNLFKRPNRSFQAKTVEAINALRLEHYYSKEQIIEFYANQFHVNGNGRGIAIAARYFFNKTVSELSLVESAFIAGMVKGPNLYDPLHQRSEERREKSLQRAHDRVSYVLSRMYTLGKISEEQYDEAMVIVKEKSIPFSRGHFRFENNVIGQEVAQRLQSPFFQKILRDVGIDDPSSAGLHIVTTIDEQTQRSALYGLRTHLSELGPRLKGVEPSLVVESDFYRSRPLEHPPKPFSFHYAQVKQSTRKKLTLNIRGHMCLVHANSRKNTAKAMGLPAAKLHTLLKEGDVVRVRLDDKGACFIMASHDLEGGVLAVQHGGIVAMVGGKSNKDLNRALTSERQLGSVWKTLIYGAALQLGWSTLDMLDNIHNAFYFERGWYFPKAAHRAEDFVSMNWAGTHSENKASVWLMMHLGDKLTASQLEELAAIVGLTQHDDETEQEYRIRIRDRYGVISTQNDLEQIAFSHAKIDILSKAPEEMQAPLMALEFGGSQVEKRLLRRAKNEKIGLEHNWTRLNQRMAECDAAYEALQEVVSKQSRLHYDFFTLDEQEPPTLSSEIQDKLWMGEGYIGCGFTHNTRLPLPRLETWTQTPPLYYDGYFSAVLMKELAHKIKKYRALYRNVDGYSIKRLVHHRDFRFVMYARYVSMLVQKMGIQKNMALNMSIPLGVVDITLAESLAMYEGVLTGQRYISDHDNLYRLIDKIYYTPHPFDEGSGKPILLYSSSVRKHDIVSQRSGDRALSILSNVVEYGTGKRVQGGIQGFPVFGKTGTTNRSMNAAFCGVVPSVQAGGWSFREGLFVSSYVGFDTPKPMRKGRYGISGASGALPIWKHVVSGAIGAGLLGDAPIEKSWSVQKSLQAIPIENTRGMPAKEGSAVAFEEYSDTGEAVRYFSPVRLDGELHEEFIDFSTQVVYDEDIDFLIPKEN